MGPGDFEHDLQAHCEAVRDNPSGTRAWTAAVESLRQAGDAGVEALLAHTRGPTGEGLRVVSAESVYDALASLGGPAVPGLWNLATAGRVQERFMALGALTGMAQSGQIALDDVRMLLSSAATNDPEPEIREAAEIIFLARLE